MVAGINNASNSPANKKAAVKEHLETNCTQIPKDKFKPWQKQKYQCPKTPQKQK